MMKKIIFVFVCISNFVFAQTNELSLLFVGDVMQHIPQMNAAYNKTTDQYDYDSCFAYVAPIFKSNDVVVANLETTLAGKPYSGYPLFSAPDSLVVSLKKAGVDYLMTANNHSCDKGKTGITRTLQVLDSLHISHTGTFANSVERSKENILLIEKNGLRVMLLNYTYGTNGIPIPEPTVVNLLDKELIREHLVETRKLNPDKIIAFLHWGNEYERLPNDWQKQMAQYLFTQGVDFIIGSHPHVLQPFEYSVLPEQDAIDLPHREKILVYSLGNFISNQRGRYKDGGAMVKIVLQKDNNGNVSVKEHGYFLVWVNKFFAHGRNNFHVLPASQFESSTQLDPTIREALKTFVTDSRSFLDEHNKNFNEYCFDTANNIWELKGSGDRSIDAAKVIGGFSLDNW